MIVDQAQTGTTVSTACAQQPPPQQHRSFAAKVGAHQAAGMLDVNWFTLGTFDVVIQLVLCRYLK